jgi:hypothetical protein
VHRGGRGTVMVGATRHDARIFPVIVGDSSTPIGAIFQRADPEWEAGRIVHGLSSGEGLISAVRDTLL